MIPCVEKVARPGKKMIFRAQLTPKFVLGYALEPRSGAPVAFFPFWLVVSPGDHRCHD
jgi:hypothetical protein